MEYTLIIGLYLYTVVKALLHLFSKNKRFQSPRAYFLEILGLAFVIAYLFNSLYFRQGEYQSFIISQTLLWVSFVCSILILGVGLGIKFAIEILNQFVSKDAAILFKQNKFVHDIYAEVWVNVGVIFLFFIFCIMEISRPHEGISTVSSFILYALSFVYGGLYTLTHRKKSVVVKKANMIALAIVGICVLLLVVESSVPFFKSLPVTTSFLLFIVSFFVFNIRKFFIKSPESDRQTASEYDDNYVMDYSDQTLGKMKRRFMKKTKSQATPQQLVMSPELSVEQPRVPNRTKDFSYNDEKPGNPVISLKDLRGVTQN